MCSGCIRIARVWLSFFLAVLTIALQASTLPSPATASGTATKTICVHKIVNITKQPRFDYLETALAEGIASRIANVPKIRVMERTQLRQVMQELKLQLSGVMDEKTVRHLGKLVGADFSLVGSFEWVDGLKVNARVVNNETGEVLYGVSKASPDRNYLEAAVACEIALKIGSPLPEPLPVERTSPQPLTPAQEDEALMLFDAKNYAGAFHAYCRASDADLDNVNLHRRIEKCARLGHLQERFLERYLDLANQQPDNAILRNYLGNAYLMLDPSDTKGKAKEQYEEVFRLDPNFAPSLNNLGIIAYRQGNWAKAESCFKRYLDACPEDATGWVNLGLLYVAMVEKDSNDVSAAGVAESAFRKAIQFHPGLASAHKGLGRLFTATERKAEALTAYQYSLMLNRDQPEVRRQVELLQRDLGGSGAPVTIFDDMGTRAALRSCGIAELSNQAAQALAQGKFQDAEALAAELCRLLPANPFAYQLLGRAYEAQGREAEAQKAMQEARRLLSAGKQ